MPTLTWVGPVALSYTEVNSLPWHRSGVYMLHGFSARLAAFPVFYIGQAMDLRRRLLRHLRPTEAKPRITTIRIGQPAFFSAAAVPADFLDAVEAGLIAALDPACNDRHPTGSRVLVNLPPLLLFAKD